MALLFGARAIRSATWAAGVSGAGARRPHRRGEGRSRRHAHAVCRRSKVWVPQTRSVGTTSRNYRRSPTTTRLSRRLTLMAPADGRLRRSVERRPPPRRPGTRRWRARARLPQDEHAGRRSWRWSAAPPLTQHFSGRTDHCGKICGKRRALRALGYRDEFRVVVCVPMDVAVVSAAVARRRLGTTRLHVRYAHSHRLSARYARPRRRGFVGRLRRAHSRS